MIINKGIVGFPILRHINPVDDGIAEIYWEADWSLAAICPD